ncbi:SPOR domain-containing protein [Citromicrobium bathyomarinum]|uniref:SPOR domain-containing protein n=1 Tax=Citromicrobium bathyomarinum TaxID=72174 RepID=UPI00315ABAFE
MRLPGKVHKFAIAFGLLASLSACAGGSGDYDLAPASDYYAVEQARPTPNSAVNGPQADYPQVLGEPYLVDGQTFVPADLLSYDAVGYATLDMIDARGVTVSHKTLPLPSYVELTSLDSGRTILARVERRGPMTTSRIVGLSQGAARELGVGEGAPVRIRRVNPPEFERAALRSGRPAGDRLDTPDTLISVLRKQLPAAGSASLASQGPNASARRPGQFDEAFAEIEPGPSTAVADSFEDYEAAPPTRPSYALAPIGELPTGANGRPAPVEVARMPATRQPPPRAAPPQAARPAARAGRYVIQVASFSGRDNAIDAADDLSGFVVRSGEYLRVRMGPYATRGEAEAALAKARSSGYRDAYIDTSD